MTRRLARPIALALACASRAQAPGRDRHSVSMQERGADGSVTPHADPADATGGSEASFGRLDVDETTHGMAYHVQASRIRALDNQDLPRLMRVADVQGGTAMREVP